MSAIPKPSLPDPASARNPFGRNPEPLTEDKPAAPQPPEDRPARVPSAPRGQEPRPAGTPPKRRGKRPRDTRDVLLSLPTELADRMESVIAYTLPITGVRTQQAFIRRAIAQACADLENQYNDGEPWPAIPKPDTD